MGSSFERLWCTQGTWERVLTAPRGVPGRGCQALWQMGIYFRRDGQTVSEHSLGPRLRILVPLRPCQHLVLSACAFLNFSDSNPRAVVTLSGCNMCSPTRNTERRFAG